MADFQGIKDPTEIFLLADNIPVMRLIKLSDIENLMKIVI